MLYLYKFDMRYVNEDVGHDSILRGIVSGYSYGEALNTAIDYVGEGNLIKIQLELIEDSEGGFLIQDCVLNPPKQ